LRITDNQFYFYCRGEYCKTTELAWESFKAEADRLFYWIRGNKYWQTKPLLFRQNTQSGEEYCVKARVIASEQELNLTKVYFDPTEVT